MSKLLEAITEYEREVRKDLDLAQWNARRYANTASNPTTRKDIRKRHQADAWSKHREVLRLYDKWCLAESALQEAHVLTGIPRPPPHVHTEEQP